MSNINKILIAVVSCVFMICVASVSIVSIVTSNEKETTTTTDAPPSQYVDPTESTTTVAPDVQTTTAASQQSPTTESASSQQTTTAVQGTASTSETAGTSDAGNTDLTAALLGSWKDSAGLFAYEFLEGGKVNVTYFDLAGFGVPLSGTAPGLYTLEGDTLTIKFSVHVATIKNVYRISINQNELSMYDLEDHETSTFMRVS